MRIINTLSEVMFKKGSMTLILYILIIVCSCSNHEKGEDWPVFLHDNRHSGVTGEKLDIGKLHESWVYRSSYPPQPAWAGPAKWDSYAKTYPLRSMRNYDSVFHVIVVDNSLYFGSSVEDAAICLNTKNGKEKWAYISDGPVRIVPAFADGKIYFSSDDGFAYCLKAKDGTLIWKFKPSPDEPLIPSNGKFISQWPCRTGVIVENQKAYFGASLLPWKQSYLCAVDANNGSPEGPGRYKIALDNKTLEGALLASSGRLYLTQGRVPPIVYDISNGKLLGQLTGGGGVFAIITPDSRFLHGPGNKTGWITESDAISHEQIAQYPLGNAVIATGDMYYLLTDTTISAVHRTTKKKVWTSRCNYPFSLILANDVLFAGGDREVAAFNSSDGKKIWTAKVEGKAFGLAAANGKLFVSTDSGAIHCFGK